MRQDHSGCRNFQANNVVGQQTRKYCRQVIKQSIRVHVMQMERDECRQEMQEQAPFQRVSQMNEPIPSEGLDRIKVSDSNGEKNERPLEGDAKAMRCGKSKRD